MGPKRIERNAGVALVAMWRSWVTEGRQSLSPDEIAARVGFKRDEKLDDEVLTLMVERGWAKRRGQELELTPGGRKRAEQILDAKQSR